MKRIVQVSITDWFGFKDQCLSNELRSTSKLKIEIAAIILETKDPVQHAIAWAYMICSINYRLLYYRGYNYRIRVRNLQSEIRS